MAELPKREQAHPTFDTLYTLAKKLEAGQPAHTCQYTSSSEMYREKHRHYPVPAGRVAALEEEGLASTDPVTEEDYESEVEVVGGLNVHLAQVMSRYPERRVKVFRVWVTWPFRRWHREQTNPKGAGESSSPAPESVNTRSEVNVHVIGQIWNPLLEAGGPTSHWIGPETLVDLTIEGRNVNALADSGSQVNMITPTLVQQYGFLVLPLEDLVDYPLNLVGLGRKHTSLLRFIILHVQVLGIAGYDEDAVFLVVPDGSKFGQRVPLVVGTCTIGRIINVTRESEIDHLSMPWATVRVAWLLSCRWSMAVPILGGAETQVEGASGGPPEGSINKLVMVWESIRLGPFQTEIIEGWVKPLLGDTSHMMITPLRAEGRPWEAKPLPPGLHILHALPASRTAVERYLWWSEMCLTATSSSRRVCLWCGLCWHHWCHPSSCHQRWKPL